MTKPILIVGDASGTVASRAALTVRRILKVNHAGEHGAIRIYGAQIASARRLYPDIVSTLEEMRSHEIEHCQVFRGLMPDRNARPCSIMALWGVGGYVLGFFTALLGRRSIWVCTAAVESAVHRHLDDQLHFLRTRDGELHRAIIAIREEELAHLRTAENNAGETSRPARLLHHFVAMSTEILIWLSTWGDSTRMARELRRAGASA